MFRAGLHNVGCHTLARGEWARGWWRGVLGAVCNEAYEIKSEVRNAKWNAVTPTEDEKTWVVYVYM